MKLIRKNQLLTFLTAICLSACGNASVEVENKLKELQQKTESLDSIINNEVDKVVKLDSIINEETEKVKKLDTLLNQSASELDSIVNKSSRRLGQ